MLTGYVLTVLYEFITLKRRMEEKLKENRRTSRVRCQQAIEELSIA